jgi:hypothetical protein
MPSITDKNILKNLYDEGCKVKFDPKLVTTDAKYRYASSFLSIPHFSFNVDKLIRRRLYSLSKARVVTPEEFDISADWDSSFEFSNLITEHKFRRSPDGKFFMKKDNDWVPISKDDADGDELLAFKNSCYGTGYSVDNKGKCRDMIFDCLLNDDPASLDSCLKKLTATDFFDTAKKQIDSMHPIVALRTLQRFGFQTFHSHDSVAQQNLKKVQCVNDWLKTFMSKQFTQPQQQSLITGNSRLLAYLQLLSEFVNANPGLLNPHVDATTEEKAGQYHKSQYAERLNIPMREEPSSDNSQLYEMSRLSKFLKEMQRSRNPVWGDMFNGSEIYGTNFMNQLMPIMIGVQNRGFPQLGGGDNDPVGYYARRFNQGAPTGAKLQQKIFNDLVATLERGGVPKDAYFSQFVDQTQKRINQNIRFEDEIWKRLILLQECLNLLMIFDGSSQTILSLKKLVDMVKSTNKVLNGYNDNGNSIAANISSMLTNSFSKILNKASMVDGYEKISSGLH